MTKEETTKILVLISGVYQNFQISPATCDVWHEIFKDFQYSDIAEACFVYFKGENNFPPVPGNLLAALRSKAKGLILDADTAWQCVLGRCSNVRALDLSTVPPSVQRAMRGIGWERVAYADIQKELPWIQREFVANFEQEIENEVTGNLPMLLLRRDNVDALPSGDAERAGTGRRGGEILRQVFHAVAETKSKDKAPAIKEVAK